MNNNTIAVGAPGINPRWTSSAKDVIGTAYHTSSCGGFTLSPWIINEIYIPHVDQRVGLDSEKGIQIIRRDTTPRSIRIRWAVSVKIHGWVLPHTKAPSARNMITVNLRTRCSQ